jgi:hypothetical protein
MAQVASKLFAHTAEMADFNEGFVQLGKIAHRRLLKNIADQVFGLGCSYTFR